MSSSITNTIDQKSLPAVEKTVSVPHGPVESGETTPMIVTQAEGTRVVLEQTLASAEQKNTGKETPKEIELGIVRKALANKLPAAMTIDFLPDFDLLIDASNHEHMSDSGKESMRADIILLGSDILMEMNDAEKIAEEDQLDIALSHFAEFLRNRLGSKKLVDPTFAHDAREQFAEILDNVIKGHIKAKASGYVLPTTLKNARFRVRGLLERIEEFKVIKPETSQRFTGYVRKILTLFPDLKTELADKLKNIGL